MDPIAKFYYLRDSRKSPFVTVCIGRNRGGMFIRGITACSKKDIVKKDEGRKRAYARMLEANFFENCVAIRYPKRIMNDKEVYEYLKTDLSCGEVLKLSEYNATLSDFEKGILNARAPKRRAVSKAKKAKK